MYDEISFKFPTLLEVVYPYTKTRTFEIKLLEYNVPQVGTSGTKIPGVIVISDDFSNGIQDNVDPQRTEVGYQDALQDLDNLVDRLIPGVGDEAVSSQTRALKGMEPNIVPELSSSRVRDSNDNIEDDILTESNSLEKIETNGDDGNILNPARINKPYEVNWFASFVTFF